MAPKRPSPLDEPPAASSSEEEVASSEEEVDGEEEEESGSGSESESEEPEPPKAAPTPVAEKKPPPKKPDSATVNSKPQSSSSGSESESESDSELDKDMVVKPIASKPMEETPKTKKPRSKASATTTPAARAGSKRPSESDPKDSKRPKKKIPDPDQEPDHAGEETKKAGGDDSKKLFQRIWSDDDEIAILKGMIDYSTKKGADPYSDMGAFHDFIKKSLKADVNKTQLQDKIRRLKKKYEMNVAKGKKYNPVKPHEQKVFDLSNKVWGSGEGSIGVGGLSEQSKSNGKARTNQKGNNKTLASLKAEILSSPEPPKECEKVEIGSESLSEVIGYDKGFRELGLPEGVVKQGLELIGGAKRAELKEKWKKLHVAELDLFVKRSELMRDQAKVILEALKSSEH
ncbi:GLABROUS1 enhancer-binding protein-like [Prunus avium]|uniref:GLABROUS1 enhancer-binding protein-like n=1 Tax=Prunus avium TaxID=42229 RepID=A0A6P5TMQ2_PRUAV|nr:GLABROUS1 enhancer-binding protein-like [Prunus avium]